MDNIKNIIGGGLITLVVGGTLFSFSQEDLVNNLSEETGLTTEQAEQYVNSIEEEDLVTFTEIGETYLEESSLTMELIEEIDCTNYEYTWQSDTLTCQQGLAQLQEVAAAEKDLGESLVKMDSEDGETEDIEVSVENFDRLHSSYQLEVMGYFYESEVLDEILLEILYNKSILKSALDSLES